MGALDALARMRSGGQLSLPRAGRALDSAVPVLPACVVVEAAAHAYDDRLVLKGVTLSIHRGEIYGLIGANGAGKTTLMKAICGRMSLTSGTVRVDGGDPARDASARRRIGFVPQDIAIYPHLTVSENLQVFARLAGVPRSEVKRVVADTIERAGLGQYTRQLTRMLSGGYRRRVNICASILHDPVLLVLDEPTVGIDIDARAAIHGMLDDMRRRGTAILLTTHDLEQAEEMCDRVGFLAGGLLVREGKPEVLLHQAYGEDRELVATLRSPPDQSGRAFLQQIGFLATKSPITWFGHGPLEGSDAATLGRQIAEAGMVVSEIRIRRPDLGSLFLEIVGEEGRA